jgi:hypothetical protein
MTTIALPTMRDARNEARSALAEPGYEVRVLEPSRPAVAVEPFADDPAAVGTVPDPLLVVTPTTASDVTWQHVVERRPDLTDFAADRWLAAWRPLPELPAGFAAARHGLHLLAFYLMAAARRQVNGKIGLRWTRGGFGTPFFGDDVQVRVEHTHLVVQRRTGVRYDSLTTLRRAATLIGSPLRAGDRAQFDVPALGDVDADLRITAAAVGFIDAWFGLATSVLEQLRVDGAALEPGLVQLWPEHFDLAVELGAPAQGRPATFGFSPGDAAHDEPYVYVSAWEPVDRGVPFWNDTAFNGASLPYRHLAGAADPRAAALAWLHQGLAVLNPS